MYVAHSEEPELICKYIQSYPRAVRAWELNVGGNKNIFLNERYQSGTELRSEVSALCTQHLNGIAQYLPASS